MPTRKSPRKGSLQFWPRKRARRFLPKTNWDSISSNKPLKGFLAYKAGMVSAAVKDETEYSMTKGKIKVVPATILECPPMRILSVRFYFGGIVSTEILAPNLDKELKRKLKLPKTSKNLDSIEMKDYEDVRIIVYSLVKKTNLKKTPDILEIGLNGSFEEKLDYIKNNLDKEISVLDVFGEGQLVDSRGLTKGKGLQGPVKRFGITLKSHKSEKGVRRPGSLGPWHPARVIFRVPMAGQMGMFTREVYNSYILDIGASNEKFKNIKNYGDIKTNYVLLEGSIQGPSKRQVVLTFPLRPNRKQSRKEHKLIELR